MIIEDAERIPPSDPFMPASSSFQTSSVIVHIDSIIANYSSLFFPYPRPEASFKFRYPSQKYPSTKATFLTPGSASYR